MEAMNRNNLYQTLAETLSVAQKLQTSYHSDDKDRLSKVYREICEITVHVANAENALEVAYTTLRQLARTYKELNDCYNRITNAVLNALKGAQNYDAE